MNSQIYRARPDFFKQYIKGQIETLKRCRCNRELFHAKLNYIMYLQGGAA
jgi:hypothetical protein